jgi:hypothetical protein
MIISSWPEPPIHEDEEAPEIPKEYRCFGILFEVDHKNIPYQKNTRRSESFKKEEVKSLVSQSFSTFSGILDVLTKKKDTSRLIEELKDIHLNINKAINGCRYLEGKEMLSEIREKSKKKKSELVTELNKFIS